MPISSDGMERIVRREAPRIAEAIRQAAEQARNEMEFRRPVANLIEEFAKEKLDLELSPREEYTLINGRADAVYNRFVVEYEPPGSLRSSNGYVSNQHAIGQVKQYIQGLEERERRRRERVAGVATDGSFFIFVRFREGRWRVDAPVEVTATSTERFLRYLSALSAELPLTPERLLERFGEDTDASRLCVSTFYEALTTTDNPKVRTLFREWQRLFREICGWEKQSSRLKLGKLASSFGVTAEKPDPLTLFFAVHTYYATFIKLLAVQVASFYAFPKLGTGLQQVASYASERLRRYLAKMERGGVFSDFGITNFLEGDFFGWYLDIWNDEMDQAVRRIIGELANYSLVTLDVEPEQTRDLLKKLYQSLMPRKLRHALGEYYTPDWLAERVLNQLGVRGDPDKRLLDPGCGSGTFLVLTIRRVREYAAEKMMPEAEALDKILANVVGFDLNPLAVISARTNYLMALGDLVQHRKGEISIPIYLADSIMTPTQGTRLETYGGVEFCTAVGKFAVPRSLVSARAINRLATMLEECVDIGYDTEGFRGRLLSTFAEIKGKEEELAVAEELYGRLRELDEEGINGIWARIIKNAFAPLFQGRFDYVAGNPPWVNWESLPDEYRKEVAPLWAAHDLFPHKGFDAILGGSKDDISILMTYTAIDKYLKEKGKLGFLITQSVFKTAGGGQGFRGFQLGDGIPLSVVHIDDMSELKPFPGAANRTAIVVLEKGRATEYPVPYTYWRGEKRGRGRRRTIPEDVTLEEATKMTERSNFVAEPVDDKDITSSWITGRPRALSAVRKVLGLSDYEARAGVCTWMNAVYWVQIIGQRPDGLIVVSNLLKGAKRKVEDVQTAIEPDLLYPLLRGRDVERWEAKPSAYIIVTHEPGMGLNAVPEDEMKVRYPKTYAYFKRFEEVLRSRSGYRRYFSEDDPFYSMFDVGDYTFAPYKVVWPWISKSLACAVVSSNNKGKIIVPEHNTSFIDFGNPEAAHFFCACFNASATSFAAISSYSGGGGGIASPNVVERIHVPSFDPANPIHQRLAALSKQAHRATAAGGKERLQEIEAEIDELAAELWGLARKELQGIRESLKELTG